MNRFNLGLLMIGAGLAAVSHGIATNADPNLQLAEKLFPVAEMVKWVQTQYDFGERHPGSPAEKKNEKFLLETLRSFGLEARLEPVLDPLLLEETPQTTGEVKPGHVPNRKFPIEYWNVDEKASSFTVYDALGGRKIAAYPIPHTPFTDTRAKILTYADRSQSYGKIVPEWRDKIVVARISYPPIPADKFLKLASYFGIYDDEEKSLNKMNHGATWVREGWELYDIAQNSGAAGFVGILVDQPGGDYRNYGPYGFKERDMLNKRIPAVWVSRRDEHALIEAARKGVAAEMTNVGTVTPTVANNVIAEIPGQTDEAILISCHTDSPFLSPVEDASGIATVLAIAKQLAAEHHDYPLRRRVIIVLSAGHFYGSVGTRSFIQSHPELLRADHSGHPKAVLEISLEHVAREAVEGADGTLVTVPSPEYPKGRPEPSAIFLSYNKPIRDAVLSAIHKYHLDRTVLLGASGALGDYPPTDGGDWYTAGIPTINHIANPVNLLTDSQDYQDPRTHEFKWLATERFPRMAATYYDVIQNLDKVETDDLFASGLQKGWIVNKIAKYKIQTEKALSGSWRSLKHLLGYGGNDL